MRRFLMAMMSVLALTAFTGCGDDKDDKKEEAKACCHDHEDGGACTDCGDNCPCGDDCQCGDNCDCADGACDAGCCGDDCQCEDCQCEGEACPADGACDDHSEVSAQTVQPFELPNMNASGTIYRSADFINGIFVVENYFINCPYCNDNAPNVHAMQAEYAQYGQVQFLDVGIDRTDRQYEQWISRHSPVHPVLKDDSRVLTNQLGTTGFPSAYLIDCHMNVVYKTTGVWDASTKQEIKAKIAELMLVPCYLTVPEKN